MNGVQLHVATQDRCRDLGVMFTSDLSWTEHYNIISCKAFQILGLIGWTFSQYAPSSVKKLLYLTLVHPHLTYCSSIWRPPLIKNILLLEQVQPTSTKYIFNYCRSDYKTRLASLHLLLLMYTYELYDILFLIQSLQNPDPSFPVMKYISFSTSSTRSGAHSKLTY